jgi:hypothetical protein
VAQGGDGPDEEAVEAEAEGEPGKSSSRAKSARHDDEDDDEDGEAPPLPGSEEAAAFNRKRERASYDDEEAEPEDDDAASKPSAGDKARPSDSGSSGSDGESDDGKGGQKTGEGQARGSVVEARGNASCTATDASERRARVLKRCLYVSAITDSRSDESDAARSKPLHYVEIVVSVSLAHPRLLLMGLAESAAEKCLLRSHGKLGGCVALHSLPRLGALRAKRLCRVLPVSTRLSSVQVPREQGRPTKSGWSSVQGSTSRRCGRKP